MTFRSILCIAAAASLSACGGASRSTPSPVSAAPRVLQVATAPGVSLEVVDWGGSGRPVVFLGGGGHTAHEFDEFAPLLTRNHRVLGITRRGAGASSDVPADSLQDLVGDIVAVIDSLRLGPAVLVGHSFAGFEMALFGETHGGRCAGLVYLDAAYDYTDPGLAPIFETTPPPSPPEMQPADSASVRAVQAFFERTNGFRMPESEIRATRRFGPDGRMVANAPSQTQRAMGGLVRAPRWDAIQCPSLGLYPVSTVPATWLGWYAQLDAAGKAQADAYFRAFGAWTAGQRARFAQAPGNRAVEFPGTGHYFFLEKPREASQAILDFLAELR
jgi:pimeloyl-ACP methyl ester carboxylesterase